MYVRYKHPRQDTGYHGGWGGVGRKPADKVWRPGQTYQAPKRKDVPKRFRFLRLRRRRRPRDGDGAGARSWQGDVIVGVVCVLSGLAALFTTYTDYREFLSAAPLVCLGLLTVGAMFIGRGLSKRAGLARAAARSDETKPLPPLAPPHMVRRVRGWGAFFAGYVAWILLGFPLWLPLGPVKVAGALVLFLALGVSLDVGGRLRAEAPRKATYRPGRFAARAAPWPLWRRGLATASAAVLVSWGGWQAIFYGDGHPPLPLRRGLYLIVTLAVGVPLLIVANTPRRERRTRK